MLIDKARGPGEGVYGGTELAVASCLPRIEPCKGPDYMKSMSIASNEIFEWKIPYIWEGSGPSRIKVDRFNARSIHI